MQINVAAEVLREQIVSIFSAWGTPQPYAEIAAQVMVDTDLRGIESHGVGMLPTYYRWWHKDRRFVLDASIQILRDLPSIALIDGGHGLGHPIAVKAMEVAVEKCRATGIGLASVRNSNHYGAAGYYASMAARQGFIGLALTGTPGPAIAPTFGREAVFGTNPIALAAPAGRNPPFVLDMATSTAAIGKLAVARRREQPIPEGWALDENGLPTTDTAAALAARLLTPLGGDREHGSHKGYGLAALVDILSSTLSGAAIAGVATHFGRDREKFNIGHFMLAIDPRAVLGEDDFESALDDLIDALHATPAVDDQQPVLVAGDPEHAAYEQRIRSGIPMPEILLEEIREVAAASGVEFILAPG